MGKNVLCMNYADNFYIFLDIVINMNQRTHLAILAVEELWVN